VCWDGYCGYFEADKALCLLLQKKSFFFPYSPALKNLSFLKSHRDSNDVDKFNLLIIEMYNI
jgi:hypothetical protein